MAFSNPGDSTYFADLGLGAVPLPPLHSKTWRPHPWLRFVPVIGVPNGQTGHNVMTVADWTAALAKSENVALVDQAMPTISGTAPTIVDRGFAYAETTKGHRRISAEMRAQYQTLVDQKLMRLAFDDMSHGSVNSLVQLTASMTDITVDASGNLSLDGLLAAIHRVGAPCVAFICADGIQGLADSIRAEGLMAALPEQARQWAGAYDGKIHGDGYVTSLWGCRIYQTNNNNQEASRLYENGGMTHAVVMADITARNAASGSENQYDLTAPPVLIQAIENPLEGLPSQFNPRKLAELKSGSLGKALGRPGSVGIYACDDISQGPLGEKTMLAWAADFQITDSSAICAVQYQSAYS